MGIEASIGGRVIKLSKLKKTKDSRDYPLFPRHTVPRMIFNNLSDTLDFVARGEGYH